MTEVRTRDEAIASVDQALRTWLSIVTGLLTQAQNTASVARGEIEALVRQYANEVAAAEALLAASDAERRRELEGNLIRARDSLEKAKRAGARVRQLEARVSRLHRAHMTSAATQVSSAGAQLSAMSRALDGYRAGGASLAGGASSGSSRPSQVGGSTLATLGLADIDVSSARLDDNPVLDDDRSQGTFGKGGLSRADYRWAVQTWSDTVGPGVAGGKTREAFAERDNRSGAQPLRRTADVYDMFVGTDRIRADRRPDGSLDIVNGRHRLLIARELGIKSLPGQVSE